MNKVQLLVVEDDDNLGTVIKDYLIISGYDVILCKNGVSGWENYKKEKPSLCILDIMLPEKDGFELAELIRSQNDLIPIVFLTAKSSIEDKIKGFKTGADDYIVKPFNIEELVLRIEALLKRSGNNNPLKNKYIIGNYTFEKDKLQLSFNESKNKLTQREADILEYLLKYKNNIVRREDLLTALWGENDYFFGRSLDVFISKLRKYLNSDPCVRIINYHSIGFMLEIKTTNT
jgi:DNA-binding response OmpR family regulator